MKRLILCLVLVLGFAQFNYLGTQDVQIEQLYLGSITDIPATVMSTPGTVVACGVNIGDPSWTLRYIIDYVAGQTWYMEIIVLNWSSSTQYFKLEYDVRYADGFGYKVYRSSNSISGLSYAMYRINVTSCVAKLGLLTLTGRVYGAGMGNDNKVTSQVVAY
jgi:hypothetical protein